METFDYTRWSDEQLHNEVIRLEDINEPWQSPERRVSIRRQIAHMVFEQIERYKAEHEEVDINRFKE